LRGEIVIDKPGKGAFYGTCLGDILRTQGVEQLAFAGVTTAARSRVRSQGLDGGMFFIVFLWVLRKRVRVL